MIVVTTNTPYFFLLFFLVGRVANGCKYELDVHRLKQSFPDCSLFLELAASNGLLEEIKQQIGGKDQENVTQPPIANHVTIFIPSDNAMREDDWVFQQPESNTKLIADNHVVFHSTSELSLMDNHPTLVPGNFLRFRLDKYPTFGVTTETADATITNVGTERNCTVDVHIIDAILVPRQLAHVQYVQHGNNTSTTTPTLEELSTVFKSVTKAGNMEDLNVNRNLEAYNTLLDQLELINLLTESSTPVTVLAFDGGAASELRNLVQDLSDDESRAIQRRIIRGGIIPNVREIEDGGMYMSLEEDIVEVTMSTMGGERKTCVTLTPKRTAVLSSQLQSQQLLTSSSLYQTQLVASRACMQAFEVAKFGNLTVYMLDGLLVPQDVNLAIYQVSQNCQKTNLNLLDLVVPGCQYHSFMTMVGAFLPEIFNLQSNDSQLTIFAIDQQGMEQLLNEARNVDSIKYMDYIISILQYHIVPSRAIQYEDFFSNNVESYSSYLDGLPIISWGFGNLTSFSGKGEIQIQPNPLNQKCGVFIYPVKGILLPSNQTRQQFVQLEHQYDYITSMANKNMSDSELQVGGIFRRTAQNDSNVSVQMEINGQQFNLSGIQQRREQNNTDVGLELQPCWEIQGCDRVLEVLEEEGEMGTMLEMIRAGKLESAYESLENVTILAFQDTGLTNFLQAAGITDIQQVPAHLLQVWLGYNILHGQATLENGTSWNTLTHTPSGVPLDVTFACNNAATVSVVGSWNKVNILKPSKAACNDVTIHIVDAPLVPLNAQVG